MNALWLGVVKGQGVTKVDATMCGFGIESRSLGWSHGIGWRTDIGCFWLCASRDSSSFPLGANLLAMLGHPTRISSDACGRLA